MKLRILSLAITLFAITSVQSQEISDTSFGKGLINFVAKDSSFSVKFAPRFQVRSMSSWDHDGNQYTIKVCDHCRCDSCQKKDKDYG